MFVIILWKFVKLINNLWIKTHIRSAFEEVWLIPNDWGNRFDVDRQILSSVARFQTNFKAFLYGRWSTHQKTPMLLLYSGWSTHEETPMPLLHGEWATHEKNIYEVNFLLLLRRWSTHAHGVKSWTIVHPWYAAQSWADAIINSSE